MRACEFENSLLVCPGCSFCMGLINETGYQILRVFGFVQEQSINSDYINWSTVSDFKFVKNKMVIDYLMEYVLRADKTIYRHMSNMIEFDGMLQHKGTIDGSEAPEGQVSYRAITTRGYTNFKRKRERDNEVAFDSPITLPEQGREHLMKLATSE